MPEIAPMGNPMAISWKVTQVCWIKSPSRKPAISDERIRLGLLIKKGSIHRPDAISQSSKKPPMIAKRTTVTPKPRMESKPPVCATAASDAVAACESFLAYILSHRTSVVNARRCSARGGRYSTSGHRLRQNLPAGESQRCCAAWPWRL